jgi:hypothetical protein
MGLIAPAALLAAAVVLPPIIALYMLRMRRREQRVSSTFLWRDLAREPVAQTPWQRLRRHPLLWLQLAVALALVFALARPWLAVPGVAGEHLILILDHSASMAVVEADGTRLALAQRQARDLVDQGLIGGRVTLITVGDALRIPLTDSSDRRALRAALDALQPIGGSDLRQALTVAAALAARVRGSEIAIISDGNVRLPDAFVVPVATRYFPIGARADNAAIVALALDPGATGQQAYVQLQNHGQQAVARRLELWCDGRLTRAIDVTIDAGAEHVERFELDLTVATIEARLVGDDALALDDRAWAGARPRGATLVAVQPGTDPYLPSALALLDGVELVAPDAAVPADITILDGVVPDPLPAGHLVFIAPPRSTEWFSVTGTLEFPPIRTSTEPSPLLQHVALGEVSVLRAVRIVPGAWAQVLATGDGAPLLVAGESAGRRIVVLAFALADSDLPLQIAFPVLLANIIDALAPDAAGGSGAISGMPLRVPLRSDVVALDVTTPDGTTRPLRIDAGAALVGDTRLPGIYRFAAQRSDGARDAWSIAVNPVDAGESQVGPQATLPIGQVGGLGRAITRAAVGRAEGWAPLAALVLLLVLLEWLVTYRGALAGWWAALRDGARAWRPR